MLYDKIIEEFLSRPSELAFLTGAGVSMPNPSGLPSAREFLAEIIDDVAETEPQKNTLMSFVFASDESRKTIGDFLRFETVMAMIQMLIDPSLETLGVFSSCEKPNYYHKYLAQMLEQGAMILTTNFDNLTEIACRNTGLKYDLIVTEEDIEKFTRQPGSFPRPIVKLHGGHNALRSDGSRLGGIQNIQATVFQVGRSYPDFKRTKLVDLLSLVFARRKVIVIGYSGYDDFDIIPALNRIIIRKGLLWIDHQKVSSTKLVGLKSDLNDIAKTKDGIITMPHYRLLESFKYKHKKPVAWFVEGDTPTLLGIQDSEDACEYNWQDKYNEWARRILGCEANAKILLASLLSAVGLAEEGISISKNILKKKIQTHQKIYLWCQIANYYYSKHKFDDAIENLARIIASPPEEVDQMSRAYSFYCLARICTDQGKLDEAGLHLSTALKMFEKEDDPARLSDCLHELGRIHIERKDFVRATECLNAAIRLSEEIGDIDGVAMSYNELGRACLQSGDTKGARSNMTKAVEIFSLTGNVNGLGISYHGLGLVETSKRNFSEALAKFQIAIYWERQGSRSIHLGHSLHCAGDMYLSLGEREKAKECLMESLQIKKSIQDLQGIANTEMLLGVINAVEMLRRKTEKRC